MLLPTLSLSTHLSYISHTQNPAIGLMFVAEETDQLQEPVVESGVVVTPTKPKKGKAALPLKSDARRSKRFSEIQKLRENKKVYDLKTEISLLKQMASTKFVETAEAHFRLIIDPKCNDQQLRATVNLPKGTGQTVRVLFLLKESRNFGTKFPQGGKIVTFCHGRPLERSSGRLSGDSRLPVSCLFTGKTARVVKSSLEHRCEAPSTFTVDLQNFWDIVFTAIVMNCFARAVCSTSLHCSHFCSLHRQQIHL
ncbi:unnamed protein product [Camellia sinensis]